MVNYPPNWIKHERNWVLTQRNQQRLKVYKLSHMTSIKKTCSSYTDSSDDGEYVLTLILFDINKCSAGAIFNTLKAVDDKRETDCE